ncbi:MAG: hypothetical protein ACTSY1_05960 [Alphaproteobacteria bacterium]
MPAIIRSKPGVIAACFLVGVFLVMVPAQRAAAQLPIAAPKVFVEDAAQAFLSALATKRPPTTLPQNADVVVLVLDTRSLVHLVIIDVTAGKNYWGIMTLEELSGILARLGRAA